MTSNNANELSRKLASGPVKLATLGLSRAGLPLSR